MFGIGPMELVLILVVALLVLGPKRMPDLARTVGRGLRELRSASNELRQSLALDDLQNDLRKGLSGQGTIQKPGQKSAIDDDRPAQAGDDLAPGAGGAATDSSGDEPVSAGSADSTPSHPGELPLDEDPHTHHQTGDDVGETPVAPIPKSTPADSELGNVPVSRARSTDDERG